MDYSVLLPEEVETQPGSVNSVLRKRMGTALADLFDEHGPQIYSKIVSALKQIAVSTFEDGIVELEKVVADELGSRGLDESKKHIRDWVSSVVEDVLYYGIGELSLALGNIANDLVSDYIQWDEDEFDEALGTEDLSSDLLEITDNNLDEEIDNNIQEDVDKKEEKENSDLFDEESENVSGLIE